MALTKISGPVINFRQSTEVKSATSTSGAFGMGRTTMKTEKAFTFRVGNRPVSMKFPSGDIDLTDGDQATVVGQDSSSGIKGILVRNDGTGITYGISMSYWLGWGIALTVLGFLLLAALIGIVLLPVGLYMLYKAYQRKQAEALLAT
ncbi:MAG: hypothetical protein IT494_06740 [Gammaproteobacteria bacterium]|nr:hypothetical protein [Gammaproteobacteria bacterium]